MVKVKSRRYQEEPATEQDIIMKIGPLRLYFQNTYTIISLVNDIITGALYFIGSICNFVGAPAIYGNSLYLIGGFSFVMRPIIKLIHNIHIYNKQPDKKHKDEAQFNRDKLIEVKHSQQAAAQKQDYLGQAYQDEYYNSNQ
ncbi:hypothetical protein AWM75_00540 [Aerococcus urinaehominis]|uniref:Uncharacterized protein n=1 Tax=Aerococcus urinaehominis TaxID=128944 RepID=A0A0X8FJN5_9LACT|nr:YrhK family protein [Aerococcus urinaehominis]AMB98570.1 hypothetical protein AWM75_00540 [Aerococcus urinaehominis]SDL77582.1 YrhK-like protein [Aerococcus urinaehominis]